MAYFAVTRYVMLTDTLPMTPQGKVRKQELRDAGTAACWDREAANVVITGRQR
ncbi:hypothetical protein [Streptomyces sp. ISID311]|uniref:hypothetical protein n=1 Tax=Streptomyces sp. ISID311 TaxID=2601673 RepID=UPI00164C8445|nr:hypothetical protein [Streptomyces sp. ISID311]